MAGGMLHDTPLQEAVAFTGEEAVAPGHGTSLKSVHLNAGFVIFDRNAAQGVFRKWAEYLAAALAHCTYLTKDQGYFNAAVKFAALAAGAKVTAGAALSPYNVCRQKPAGTCDSSARCWFQHSRAFLGETTPGNDTHRRSRFRVNASQV